MAKTNRTAQVAGIGIALTAAAAAAAAGAYFLYGKDGAKNRKAVRSWMLKMRGEVLEKMERMREIDEKAYRNLVREVGEKYRRIKGMQPAEVAAVMKELTDQWKHIKANLGGKAPAKKAASKARTGKTRAKRPVRK